MSEDHFSEEHPAEAPVFDPITPEGEDPTGGVKEEDVNAASEALKGHKVIKPLNLNPPTDDTPAADGVSSVAAPPDDPAAEPETEDDMKRAKKAKGKAKHTTRARKARKVSTKRRESTRVLKTYRLVNGIPDTIRLKSAGRKILEVIERHGSPTTAEIQAALPAKFPTPTVRFYLGKFQQKKIVTSKTPRRASA